MFGEDRNEAENQAAEHQKNRVGNLPLLCQRRQQSNKRDKGYEDKLDKMELALGHGRNRILGQGVERGESGYSERCRGSLAKSAPK